METVRRSQWRCSRSSTDRLAHSRFAQQPASVLSRISLFHIYEAVVNKRSKVSPVCCLLTRMNQLCLPHSPDVLAIWRNIETRYKRYKRATITEEGM